MKKSTTASLLASTILLGGLIPGENVSAAPHAQGFICGTSSGVPTTKAAKSDGSQVDIIRWTSNSFSAGGWEPQRRCQEVSKRFDQYLKEGRLKYLTTGRMNGVPVICTSLTNGGPCDGLLYTLKPTQNPTVTLENLLEVKKQKRGPLNETSTRIYIDIDQVLNKEDYSAVNGNKVKQPSSAMEAPLF